VTVPMNRGCDGPSTSGIGKSSATSHAPVLKTPGLGQLAGPRSDMGTNRQHESPDNGVLILPNPARLPTTRLGASLPRADVGRLRRGHEVAGAIRGRRTGVLASRPPRQQSLRPKLARS